VFGGWIWVPGHSCIEHFLGPYRQMYGGPESAGVDLFGRAMGTTVFALGYFTAFAFYGRGLPFASWVRIPIVKQLHALCVRKWYMDDLWNGVLQWVGYRLAAAASWIDANIVDGSVQGVGALFGWLGEALRTIQTGLVQRYAFVIFASVLAILLVLTMGGYSWISLL